MPANLGINRYSSAIPPAHPFLERALFPSPGFFFHQETPFSSPPLDRAEHIFLPPKLFCETRVTNFGHLSSRTKYQDVTASDTSPILQKPPQLLNATFRPGSPTGQQEGISKGSLQQPFCFCDYFCTLRPMSTLSFILSPSLPGLLTHGPSGASEVLSPLKGHGWRCVGC